MKGPIFTKILFILGVGILLGAVTAEAENQALWKMRHAEFERLDQEKEMRIQQSQLAKGIVGLQDNTESTTSHDMIDNAIYGQEEDIDLDGVEHGMDAENEYDEDYMQEPMMMDESHVSESYLDGRNFDWHSDPRKQTVSNIKDEMLIDQSYHEAKSLPSLPPAQRVAEKEEYVIQTQEEIVRGLIKDKYKETTIDLDFDQIKLGDILMTLGKAGDINMVLDPTLSEQLFDLHLKEVTIDEAIMLVANAYDLGLKRVGNSLYITSKDKLNEEVKESKVIKLKNVSVTELEDFLEDVAEEVKVNEEINSIVVVGTPFEITKVEELIMQIDQPQPQVVIEAKIIEMNKDALKELGVDWSDQIILQYQEGGRPLSFGDNESPSTSLYKVGRFERTPIQFQTAIKMLENQNKAKVLSNPRISTINDKEAEIFVGDEVPYTITTVTGGVATTEVRFVEPGIRLKITPSIIEDDFVVIKVEPEVSFIFAFRGPNDEFPHVKTREATAHVRVKNGQSLALGGLLNQEDKKNLYKVPMLGDLPLLGNLFSYEKDTVINTELIITITPMIVQGGV